MLLVVVVQLRQSKKLAGQQLKPPARSDRSRWVFAVGKSESPRNVAGRKLAAGPVQCFGSQEDHRRSPRPIRSSYMIPKGISDTKWCRGASGWLKYYQILSLPGICLIRGVPWCRAEMKLRAAQLAPLLLCRRLGYLGSSQTIGD